MPVDINGSVINSAVATGLKYKDIVIRGLVYHLEASTLESYVNGSSYWYDMIGNNSAYMANITYSTNNGGTITIGSGNFIDCGNVVGSAASFTICTWVNPGGSQTTYADIFDNNPLSYLDKHPIKNTKLYWLLSRCLEEDPNKRSIIFI